jgi:hypothetical protein
MTMTFFDGGSAAFHHFAATAAAVPFMFTMTTTTTTTTTAVLPIAPALKTPQPLLPAQVPVPIFTSVPPFSPRIYAGEKRRRCAVAAAAAAEQPAKKLRRKGGFRPRVHAVVYGPRTLGVAPTESRYDLAESCVVGKRLREEVEEDAGLKARVLAGGRLCFLTPGEEEEEEVFEDAVENLAVKDGAVAMVAVIPPGLSRCSQILKTFRHRLLFRKSRRCYRRLFRRRRLWSWISGSPRPSRKCSRPTPTRLLPLWSVRRKGGSRRHPRKPLRH